MEWAKGYSAQYYATIVDPVTFRDMERFEVVNGSISHSSDSLRESANIDTLDFSPDRECWVRIYLIARQEADIMRVPLFTGLAISPKKNIDGVVISYPVECYSVLKPCQDMYLPRGWFASRGVSVRSVLMELLKPTPANITIEGISPLLQETIIAENDETNLTMIDKVLNSVGWRLYITGNGEVVVRSKDSEIHATIGLYDDVMGKTINIERDWFSCPNVFQATSGKETYTARDDSIDSMLSTVNRGREVWIIENDCKLSDNETVAEYAIRRLKEEQRISTTISYDRRFIPNVYVGDTVKIHYPAQSLFGTYTIRSQKISLGYNATVSEEVYHDN